MEGSGEDQVNAYDRTLEPMDEAMSHKNVNDIYVYEISQVDNGYIAIRLIDLIEIRRK